MLSIAALALIGFQGGVFKRVVPVPTGKNGYEQLLQAVDILEVNRFSTYESLILQTQAPEKPSAEVASAWQELEKKSYLQRVRWVTDRNSRVRELVLDAVKRPIFDPRDKADFDTLFPELASFKSLAKFVRHDLYRSFADGQHDRAIDLAVASLDAFDQTSRGVLIEYLVGIACQAIILAAIEEQLPQLSQRDALRLEQTALSILDRKPAVRDAIEIEFKVAIGGLDKALSAVKSSEDLIGLFGDQISDRDKEKATKVLQSMSDADRLRMREAVKTRFAEIGRAVSKKFEGDEAAWASVEDEEPPAHDWTSVNGLSGAIADAMTPVYMQVGRTAAIRSTQLRLLGIASAIVRFRWEHNRLPSTVAEAVGPERALDPLAKLRFEIQRSPDGSWAVVSRGTKETGEIALRYRRPATGDGPGPPSVHRAR